MFSSLEETLDNTKSVKSDVKEFTADSRSASESPAESDLIVDTKRLVVGDGSWQILLESESLASYSVILWWKRVLFVVCGLSCKSEDDEDDENFEDCLSTPRCAFRMGRLEKTNKC